MSEITDQEMDSALRDALGIADHAPQHGADGSEVELPSLGVAMSALLIGDHYQITIWNTLHRQRPEEAPVQRVLSALLAEGAARPDEVLQEGHDRVFLIPRRAAAPHRHRLAVLPAEEPPADEAPAP